VGQRRCEYFLVRSRHSINGNRLDPICRAHTRWSREWVHFKNFTWKTGKISELIHGKVTFQNRCCEPWNIRLMVHTMQQTVIPGKQNASRDMNISNTVKSFIPCPRSAISNVQLRICEIWTKISRQNNFRIRTLIKDHYSRVSAPSETTLVWFYYFNFCCDFISRFCHMCV
jgi:hypothetical protein